MPRNMSFALTTDQVRKQSKTVTRRMGWRKTKPGEVTRIEFEYVDPKGGG